MPESGDRPGTDKRLQRRSRLFEAEPEALLIEEWIPSIRLPRPPPTPLPQEKTPDARALLLDDSLEGESVLPLPSAPRLVESKAGPARIYVGVGAPSDSPPTPQEPSTAAPRFTPPPLPRAEVPPLRMRPSDRSPSPALARPAPSLGDTPPDLPPEDITNPGIPVPRAARSRARPTARPRPAMQLSATPTFAPPPRGAATPREPTLPDPSHTPPKRPPPPPLEDRNNVLILLLVILLLVSTWLTVRLALPLYEAWRAEQTAASAPAPVVATTLASSPIGGLPEASPSAPQAAPEPSAEIGLLAVDSILPAVLSVDGQEYGPTPVRDLSLPPGRHTVRITFSDGRSQSTEVQITKGRATTVSFGPRRN